MPQSLARLHIHLIFSTKYRQRVLHDGVREALHGYMTTVLLELGCRDIIINSMEDHIHLLFDLARTVSISQAAEEVKKHSSRWIKTQGAEFADFAWQGGYAAFAVSHSIVPKVRAYIANQKMHHQQKTFEAEYLAALVQQGIPFDEQYMWD